MSSFSRDRRLVTQQDFQSVFAHPSTSKVTYKYLLALYRSNQQSHARLGIIIGKQHVKRAVDRNQIKRLIRESFRQHQERLKGLDIVLVLRSKCSPLTQQAGKKALRDDIDNVWLKIQSS